MLPSAIYPPVGGEERKSALGEGVPIKDVSSRAYPLRGDTPETYSQAPYQSQPSASAPGPYNPSQQYTNPTIPAPPPIGSEASKVKRVENEEDSLE
mmetsp:Transcript_30575/g.30051  ORF Transcript_30575/g.30051 Transcript_30575/m.30051 type:complete len:96 (-) Transcript_30575:62-349(-)